MLRERSRASASRGLAVGVGRERPSRASASVRAGTRPVRTLAELARVFLLESFHLREAGRGGRTCGGGIADQSNCRSRSAATSQVERSTRSVAAAELRAAAVVGAALLGQRADPRRRSSLFGGPVSVGFDRLRPRSRASARCRPSLSNSASCPAAAVRSCLSVDSNPAICWRASASRPSWCRSPSSARDIAVELAQCCSSSPVGRFAPATSACIPPSTRSSTSSVAVSSRYSRSPGRRAGSRSRSEYSLYFWAFAACSRSVRSCESSASSRSFDRVRLSFDRRELAKRLDLLRLEPADAGGLVEDLAAVLRGGLEQFVDAALGDDGVPAGPAPLPRNISLKSLRRAIWPLMRYSPVPSR